MTRLPSRCLSLVLAYRQQNSHRHDSSSAGRLRSRLLPICRKLYRPDTGRWPPAYCAAAGQVIVCVTAEWRGFLPVKINVTLLK